MKIIKVISSIIVIIAGAVFLMITLQSESKPNGKIGSEADVLAEKMLSSVNDAAWQQTAVLSWGFRNHNYIWDKQRHFAQVKIDENEILIDINARKGVIVKSKEVLSEEKKSKLCKSAWEYWVNDSFWLNPITKCKDGGTAREITTLDDGTEALMVVYNSGGVTPGDSYLWILDENNRPKAWKLWVSIIPVKGMEFSWDNWVQLSTGAWISTLHRGALDIKITDPKGYASLGDMNGGVDMFLPLQKADILF